MFKQRMLSLKVNKRLKKYVSQAYISLIKYYLRLKLWFLNPDNLPFIRSMFFTATEYHEKLFLRPKFGENWLPQSKGTYIQHMQTTLYSPIHYNDGLVS